MYMDLNNRPDVFGNDYFKNSIAATLVNRAYCRDLGLSTLGATPGDARPFENYVPDEDHPEETSYVPFEIAGLMTDNSITYNHIVARMTHPEQKDLSYLFEGMERPLAATLRATSGYQGLAAAQTFSGAAVRNAYAELQPPMAAPVRQRLAQAH